MSEATKFKQLYERFNQEVNANYLSREMVDEIYVFICESYKKHKSLEPLRMGFRVNELITILQGIFIADPTLTHLKKYQVAFIKKASQRYNASYLNRYNIIEFPEIFAMYAEFYLGFLKAADQYGVSTEGNYYTVSSSILSHGSTLIFDHVIIVEKPITSTHQPEAISHIQVFATTQKEIDIVISVERLKEMFQSAYPKVITNNAFILAIEPIASEGEAYIIKDRGHQQFSLWEKGAIYLVPYQLYSRKYFDDMSTLLLLPKIPPHTEPKSITLQFKTTCTPINMVVFDKEHHIIPKISLAQSKLHEVKIDITNFPVRDYYSEEEVALKAQKILEDMRTVIGKSKTLTEYHEDVIKKICENPTLALPPKDFGQQNYYKNFYYHLYEFANKYAGERGEEIDDFSPSPYYSMATYICEESNIKRVPGVIVAKNYVLEATTNTPFTDTFFSELNILISMKQPTNIVVPFENLRTMFKQAYDAEGKNDNSDILTIRPISYEQANAYLGNAPRRFVVEHLAEIITMKSIVVKQEQPYITYTPKQSLSVSQKEIIEMAPTMFSNDNSSYGNHKQAYLVLPQISPKTRKTIDLKIETTYGPIKYKSFNSPEYQVDRSKTKSMIHTVRIHITNVACGQ